MDTTLLEPLARAAQPWADLYGDSVLVQTGILFAHLVSLLAAGGFAVATDRLALRAGREGGPGREVALGEIRTVHRPVLVGLALATVTGSAMALADVRYLLASPVFWLKMAAFVALLVNGLFMVRAERRLRTAQGHARASREWRMLPGIPALRVAEAGRGPSGPGPGGFLASEPPRVPLVLMASEAAAPEEVESATVEAGGPRPGPAVARDDSGWRSLRLAALRSIGLWTLTLLLGTALTAV